MAEKGKISYYKQDGTLAHQQDLTADNLMDTLGMIVRCTMRNGEIYEGYADLVKPYAPFRDYCADGNIYLSVWTHLDEETHRLIGDNNTKYEQTFFPVPAEKIISVDAILHSGPRWGGRLYNHFFLDI